MYFSLYNGGPQNLAWSVLIAYVGALAQSASLAEMASILPMAGAQYHWTHAMAPPKIKRFITWLQGWVTWFSWISLLAGVCNVNALLLESLATLRHPDYVAQGWHTTLIVCALTVSQAAINIFAYRLVPLVETLAGILHVVLFFVMVGVLGGMGSKHDARYVFTFQSVASGWDNSFIAWNIGMLTCTWSFTGFDGALHMSEEVRQSRQAVPRALFWSIALNGILAYGMVLAVLFSLGSLDEDLNSAWPILTILLNTTGSTNATLALISLLFTISYCVGLACTATVSRLTWAWARDGGLHHSIAIVSNTYHVPVRAVALPSIMVMLLALLQIGSSETFGAIIALSSLGLYSSYFTAIATMLYRRCWRGEPLELGSWNLGRWGWLINSYALLHTTWVVIFLPWPTSLPVTPANMNYASPLFAFCVLFALGTWFLYARNSWAGPSVKAVEHVLTSE